MFALGQSAGGDLRGFGVVCIGRELLASPGFPTATSSLGASAAFGAFIKQATKVITRRNGTVGTAGTQLGRHPMVYLGFLRPRKPPREGFRLIGEHHDDDPSTTSD